MSFLKNIFSSPEPAMPVKGIVWNKLTETEQLKEIIALSEEKPVVIFKHSTRCSVSRMVLKQFETDWELQQQATPYFLDLLVNRTLSNLVSSHFGVEHQSPQVLVIKGGKAIFNTSHESIDAGRLKELINQ